MRIGTVCNAAARPCAEAKDGQILLGQRVNVALKGSVVTEQVGALALRGLTQPVVAYNVPLATAQQALRVIEGGPPVFDCGRRTTPPGRSVDDGKGARADEEPDRLPCIRCPTLGFQNYAKKLGR
jgi:hypothetical protein